MEETAAAAAKKRSPWRHVVVPVVVALILATFGQSVAAAAQNLKPRVAAQVQFLSVTYRTSRLGAPDLTRASLNSGPKRASVYSYDAYGTEGPFSSGSNPNPYGFAGERTDGSGLQWLRARFYNPSAGSFMSRDQLPGNPYAYANGDPVRFSDPTGLFAMADVGAATAGQKFLRGRDATVAFYVLAIVTGVLGTVGLIEAQPARPPQTRPSPSPSPIGPIAPPNTQPSPSPTSDDVLLRYVHRNNVVFAGDAYQRPQSVAFTDVTGMTSVFSVKRGAQPRAVMDAFPDSPSGSVVVGVTRSTAEAVLGPGRVVKTMGETGNPVLDAAHYDLLSVTRKEGRALAEASFLVYTKS